MFPYLRALTRLYAIFRRDNSDHGAVWDACHGNIILIRVEKRSCAT